MMDQILKYPRTPHITGSRIQQGDEGLKTVSLENLRGKYLVIEEKIDGANCGISFSGEDGSLLLQSRGHYLTGGYRERHFNLLKTWAGVHQERLFQVLGSRYILYGEWMYAKHTVYYDKLPHYFMEFDIYDRERRVFLSTEHRRAMLGPLPFIHAVPVIAKGNLESLGALSGYIQKSLYKSDRWKYNLAQACEKEGVDFERVLAQTDDSDLAEGLYIKWEADGIVQERYKYVRSEFIAQILSNDDHWLDRPIIPNGLEGGELSWE